jgi:uroporphyrinogen-III synthase
MYDDASGMTKTVVITRPSGPYEGHARFAAKVRQTGLELFQLPVLQCAPIPLSEATRERVHELLGAGIAGWIAFLSPSAIWAFRELMQGEPLLKSAIERSLIAVQGKGTADACRECFGRAPDFMPSVFVAEEFAREFSHVIKSGQQVLVPQSAEGRDLLAPTLSLQGHKAASFSLYRLDKAAMSEAVLKEYESLGDDETYVVFMSPSSVRATVELVGESLRAKRLISVGPLTSQAIKRAGLSVWREAVEHSEEGVLRELATLQQ